MNTSIIIIAVAVLTLIISLRRRKKVKAKEDLSYTRFCLDREDNQKKIQQEFADKQLVRDAKAEGHDMFMQWVGGNIIVIRRPIIKFILNYCPYTSKYTSEDLNKIRTDEFKKLKNEYETKHGTHRNGGLFDPGKWQGRIPGSYTGITGTNCGLQQEQANPIS